jgi:hypothetical protein
MAEHNSQQGRRPHFHRGRRGPDRRGTERRTPPRDHAPESSPRESTRENGVDVEQIMREIRSRISQRHGIELSTPQIQELAARRLEAILEPRNVKPQLLEQLRKSASAAPEIPASAPVETYEFDDATLYETHRGLLRLFRTLLNPILTLFFNPTPLIHALHAQAKINKELAAREAERERRQSEWNALQYELVQRVVVETARISIEMQALSSRIESLSAKVDFNERRVRGMETAPQPASSRPPQRQQHHEAPALPSAQPESVPAEGAAAETGGDGARRRRRRRRGRRGGAGVADAPGAPNVVALNEDDLDAGDVPEVEDEEAAGQPSELAESPMAAAPTAEASEPPVPEQAAAPVTAPVTQAEEALSPLPPVPTPPRDEPTPEHPVDRADPGPVDR